ncbi:MAG: hypothetical protein IJF64_03285, partial [Clostridia bacterium]|nr:hypothetical protein [Clostridia bacterium]
GVFSPINRLHCTAESRIESTMNKEPWFYGNGTGETVKQWLRFRHQLIPYLYAASYATHEEGKALIEPLYYEWDEPNAYRYNKQYLFGGQLLVIPITEKRKSDGYARVRAWIPQGVWTDIFTGDVYDSPKGGCEKVLLRQLDEIPVLARAGGVLPLSLEKGNGVKNPKKLRIFVWNGNGEFTLFEDGNEEKKEGRFFTRFQTEYYETEGAGVQSLRISSHGATSVIPQKRTFDLEFKNIEKGEIVLKKNGKEIPVCKKYGDFVRLEFEFEAFAEYEIIITAPLLSSLEKQKRRAVRVLTRAEGLNDYKKDAIIKLYGAKSEEEYLRYIDESKLSQAVKARLKEIL